MRSEPCAGLVFAEGRERDHRGGGPIPPPAHPLQGRMKGEGGRRGAAGEGPRATQVGPHACLRVPGGRAPWAHPVDPPGGSVKPDDLPKKNTLARRYKLLKKKLL